MILSPYAIIAMLFQSFCLVWAPFAALVCGLIARKQGMNAMRYAATGAVYSALLFVPWLWLTRSMRSGRTLTEVSSTSSYKLLYIAWMLWIVAHFALILGMLAYDDIRFPPDEWSWEYLSRSYLFGILNGLITIAGISAWIKSHRDTTFRRNDDERVDESLSGFVQLKPFAYFSANIIAFPIFLFLWLQVLGPHILGL